MPSTDDEPAAVPAADFDPVAGEAMSGMQRLIGYRLDAWRAGFCRVRLALVDHHRNRSGAVHGGIFTTLADAAGGFSGCFPTGAGERPRCVTVTLTTNFLAQPADERMIAGATVRGGGRSLFFSSMELFDGTGRLRGTGNGTFRYRRPTPRA